MFQPLLGILLYGDGPVGRDRAGKGLQCDELIREHPAKGHGCGLGLQVEWEVYERGRRGRTAPNGPLSPPFGDAGEKGTDPFGHSWVQVRVEDPAEACSQLLPDRRSFLDHVPGMVFSGAACELVFKPRLENEVRRTARFLQIPGQGFEHALDRIGNHESSLDRELHGEVGPDAKRSGHTVGDVL